MKRWQQRGEVLDSDDEDLSLNVDVATDDGPRKRIRLDAARECVVHGPSASQRSSSRSVSGAETTEKLQDDGLLPISPAEQFFSMSDGDDHGAVEATVAPVLDDNSDDAGSDDLPDIAAVLAEKPVNFEDTEPPSSPLSELSVSPTGSPFMFGSPHRLTVLPTIFHESQNVEAPIDFDEYVPARGERNLRVRKEKQLHPYLYDKTLYQRQCREGGVVPVRVVDRAPEILPTASQDPFSSGQSQDHTLGSPIPVSPSHTPNLLPIGRVVIPKFQSLSSTQHRLQPVNKAKYRRHFNQSEQFHSIPVDSPVNTHSQIPPPSPPDTTSHDGSTGSSQEPRRAFRVPPVFRSTTLPTPQISSAMKANDASSDEEDSDQRRSTRHTSSRARKVTWRVESDASTESESEPDFTRSPSRMQNDRKRLKGVLPASWLKIDIRAQQARKANVAGPEERRPGSVSPQKSTPLRGVARKVTSRRTAQIERTDIASIGDDLDSSTSAGDEETIDHHASGNLDENSIMPSVPIEIQSDDNDLAGMENDWFDPMLAQTSRSSHRRRRTHLDQPRITEMFQRAQSQTIKRSEGTSHRAKRTKEGPKTSRPRKSHSERRRNNVARSHVPHLSIHDAIDVSLATSSQIPQFVRLALRRTRGQTDHGRHSPSRKSIRMATLDDTRDALSTLRDWRARKIAPRSKPQANGPDRPDMQPSPSMQRAARPPLAEVRNRDFENMVPSPRNRPVLSVKTPVVRKPRSQQTRLQPNHIADTPEALPAATNRQRALPVKRHPVNVRMRGAQLETLQDEFYEQHRSAAFETRIRSLTERIAKSTQQQVQAHVSMNTNPGPTPAKQRIPRTVPPLETPDQPRSDESLKIPPHRRKLTARRQKPLAQRLDIDTREYRQPDEPLPISPIQDLDFGHATEDPEPVATLDAFATKYPTDFDIDRLSIHTHFHASTFIGSGDFRDTLNVAHGDSLRPRGHMRVQLEGQIQEWGAWNESIAADLDRIPSAVSVAINFAASTPDESLLDLQSKTAGDNIEYLLRSVARYYSKCLQFSDPVDRIPSVESLLRLASDLVEIYSGFIQQDKLKPLLIRILQYCTVFAGIAYQLHIALGSDDPVRKRIEELALRAGKILTEYIVSDGLADLRALYEDQRRVSSRTAGISEKSLGLSSLVILIRSSAILPDQSSLFWNHWSSILRPRISISHSADELDKMWYGVFTVLPAFAVDATGKIQELNQPILGVESWSIVRHLTERALELYEQSSKVHGSTVNTYIRSILTRCHRLVNTWGMKSSESILGIIYDFFAQRGFALLRNEESKGSPKYLENLASSPSFEVFDDDTSFQIFLKLLGSGLQAMHRYKHYQDRKISGIAWRFIPNHDRTYRKDADLPLAHLEALRNHFDLLSTLYYALPPGYRLRIDQFRRLVDLSTSHREACRLSFRAWANIACFQASTSEPLEQMHALTEWFKDSFSTTLMQYRLVRRDSEQEAHRARQDGLVGLDDHLLESTIAQNQRQIAAILVEALAGLKRVIESSSSISVLKMLIQSTSVWEVFSIFDPLQRHLSAPMLEALHAVDAALNAEARLRTSLESQLLSEDSQDFGDSSILQHLVSGDACDAPTSISIHELLLEPMGQFVSNVFGNDMAAHDDVLQTVLDVWIRLAEASTRDFTRTWISYVDEYSTHSWAQLRETRQKRSYGPYYLSRIVDCAPTDDHVRQHILARWLVSIVEREAMLKFQHRLTSTVLNCYAGERLLQNPPFYRDNRSIQFHITLSEFAQRRLALISNVLSNMRQHYDEIMHQQPAKAPHYKSMYSGMLKQLMEAMKSNYRELQSPSDTGVAASDVQGSYVEFVQQVVSSMQQHSAEIYPVDRFFTDSSVFPLPATDPTYVVGRLRSYEPKLLEMRTQKQLVVFLQTVSERAAVDDQQQYLVSQVAIAMSGPRGPLPVLTRVMFTSILPVYMRAALTTPAVWIMALPFIQACRETLGKLLYMVDFSNHHEVAIAESMMCAVLDCIDHHVRQCLLDPQLQSTPSTLRVLSAGFDLATSCLTMSSFIDRAIAGRRRETGFRLSSLNNLAAALLDQDPDGPVGLDPEPLPSRFPRPIAEWRDTEDFTEHELRATLSEWHVVNDRYYVRRGATSKELKVQHRRYEEEKEDFQRALVGFRRAYWTIYVMAGHRRGMVEREGTCELDDVVV